MRHEDNTSNQSNALKELEDSLNEVITAAEKFVELSRSYTTESPIKWMAGKMIYYETAIILLIASVNSLSLLTTILASEIGVRDTKFFKVIEKILDSLSILVSGEEKHTCNGECPPSLSHLLRDLINRGDEL